MLFKLKKGLDLPLKGGPDQRIDDANEITQVAILGADYVGLKPTMLVKEGEIVKKGTPLFEDKKNPGVIVCSPAAGTIDAINRGSKRSLISICINVNGKAAKNFTAVEEGDISSLSSTQVRKKLQAAGHWVAFRTRPYGKVPAIDATPKSIFINLMDTNPLACDPALVINESKQAFINGVNVLTRLEVPLHLCKSVGMKLPDMQKLDVSIHEFSGPHPAGLSSTHVHFIDPVDANKTVWTLSYEDVIAIGNLFTTGKIDTTRYVAMGGPLVNSPRVFRTQLGAKISQLVEGKLVEGRARIISGSVFSGHVARGDSDYLGRYDTQVSVIEENDDREFMGWAAPGTKRFSAINVFFSSIIKPKSFEITTSQNGSPRAIVPIGVFERVMPLDLLATPLIKSILVKDTDSAQRRGCLELVEEDVALMSFVDPGKHDFGPVLRDTLTQIEREG